MKVVYTTFDCFGVVFDNSPGAHTGKSGTLRTLPKLPALRVPMAPMRSKPVLLYTDASFSCPRDASGRRTRRATLGFYVNDPVTGAELWSRLVLPQSYYEYFAPDKRTYIAQAELTVAVAVWYTLPSLLQDRAVMLFIDNVQALSAIIKGYAAQPDCAALVNCFHEAVFELRSPLWAEWVASEANIADWPTRDDKVHLIPSTAKFIDMVLPPIERFKDMLDFARDQTCKGDDSTTKAEARACLPRAADKPAHAPPR